MWELLVCLFGAPAFLLPGPSAIVGAFLESRDLLVRHLVPTAGEAVLGFLVATAAGVLSGLLINRSPLMERSLYPWLVVSQTLPTVAIAPLLVTYSARHN